MLNKQNKKSTFSSNRKLRLNINGLLSSEIQSLNTIFCYKQNAEKPIYSESDSKM